MPFRGVLCIDAAVGTVLLRYFEIESLAVVLKNCELDGENTNHMKSFAPVLHNRLQDLYLAINELTGDLVPARHSRMKC